MAGSQGLREALEEAIREEPSERAHHAAYADYLQDQGDPQGEFIQVQLDLEDESLDPNRRRQLVDRETALLAEHGEAWTGDWAALVAGSGPTGRGQHDFPPPKPARYFRGLLTDLVVDELTTECARAIAGASQTRFARRLYLGDVAYDEESDERHPAPTELLAWPALANLRVFQFGWTSIEEYGDFCSHQCHQHGDEVHELVARMPLLEELYLFADSIDLDALFTLESLTHLRILQVYHNWDYPLEELAENPALTNLTHLLLHPKALGAWSDSDVYITNDGVRSLLESPHLRNLTHLRLRLTCLGDEGCARIVQSGILRRLRMLDLRHGCISDEGARLLAECPDLRNLEWLDLSRNRLTESGIALLTATGVRLHSEFQHGGSEEFLMEGDYE